MGINRIGPPCPSCGCLTTDIIRTCRTSSGDFYRRRKCPSCGHRFSTIQMAEIVTAPLSVSWKHREPIINWRTMTDRLIGLLR